MYKQYVTVEGSSPFGAPLLGTLKQCTCNPLCFLGVRAQLRKYTDNKRKGSEVYTVSLHNKREIKKSRDRVN